MQLLAYPVEWWKQKFHTLMLCFTLITTPKQQLLATKILAFGPKNKIAVLTPK